MRNADDETGSYVIYQGATTPLASVVKPVDENGQFHLLKVLLETSPDSVVHIPVYVPEDDDGNPLYLINVSSPNLHKCPWSSAGNGSAHPQPSGVPDSARCVTFKQGQWNTPQAIAYYGTDDQTRQADGYSAFQLNFGPSFSDDASFDGLTDYVTGIVVDNEVLAIDTLSCNTSETGARNASEWEGSFAASYYGADWWCDVVLSIDDDYFYGSGADKESSITSYEVYVDAHTQEGVFALTNARGAVGRETDDGVARKDDRRSSSRPFPPSQRAPRTEPIAP
jgi:hypothetical protein